MKKQKGITLIALIITIIVMLILVGVSVTVALNGGLFSIAQKATRDTEAERDKELALSDGTIEVDGKKYASYDDYLNNNPIIIGEWQQTGNEIKYVTEDGIILTTLNVGDIVNYNPGEEGTGSTEVLSTAKIEDLGSWKVLGLNEEGQIELISEKVTSAELTLSGGEGWLNGPTMLNTFCDDLYGNGNGAAGARSIKHEEIYKLAGVGIESLVETEYTIQYDSNAEEVKYIKTAEYVEDMSNSKWISFEVDTVATPVRNSRKSNRTIENYNNIRYK